MRDEVIQVSFQFKVSRILHLEADGSSTLATQRLIEFEQERLKEDGLANVQSPAVQIETKPINARAYDMNVS